MDELNEARKAAISALKDSDVAVRIQGAFELARFPDAISHLIDALDDTDEQVYYQAYSSLLEIGVSLDELLRLLQSEKGQRRRAGLGCLQVVSIDNQNEFIFDWASFLLTDIELEVRSTAAYLLLRRVARESLCDFLDISAKHPIESGQCVDSRIRHERVRGILLAGLGATPQLDLCERAIHERDAGLRIAGLFGLAFAQQLPSEVVVALSSDVDASVRRAVCLVSAEMRDPSTISVLHGRVRDQDVKTRSLALTAIGQCLPIPTNVLESVISCLEDVNPNVRSSACVCLRHSEAAGRSAITTLLTLVADQNFSVAFEAIRTIVSIRPTSASVLVDLLDVIDGRYEQLDATLYTYLVDAIVYLLDRIDDMTEIRSACRRLVGHHASTVRESARSILNCIEKSGDWEIAVMHNMFHMFEHGGRPMTTEEMRDYCNE